MIAEKARQIFHLLENAKSYRLEGNEKTAQLYEECARKLREKYNLPPDILIEDDDPREGYYFETVYSPLDRSKFQPKPVLWEEHLLKPIAELFDCKPLFQVTSNLKAVLGEKADRRKAINCYLKLYDLALDCWKAHYAGEKDSQIQKPTAQRYQRMKYSYLLGFADSIDELLDQAFKYRAQTAQMRGMMDESGSSVSVADSAQTAPPIDPAERETINPSTAGNITASNLKAPQITGESAPCAALVRLDRIILSSAQNQARAFPPIEILMLPETEFVEPDEDYFDFGSFAAAESELPEALRDEIRRARTEFLETIEQFHTQMAKQRKAWLRWFIEVPEENSAEFRDSSY